MPKWVLNSQLERDDDEVYYFGGEPFTGICYTRGDDGAVVGETEYEDGVECGYVRTWFPSGMPCIERRVWDGMSHGLYREWHENGQLAVKGLCELHFCRWEKRWDEEGNLIREYELTEDDRQYRTLVITRNQYAELQPPPLDERETDPAPRPDPP